MKTIKFKNRIGLFAGIVLVYFGMQISCTPDQQFERITEVTLQIPLPGPTENLKSANFISGVARVTVTVTTGNKILAEEELSISGNTASGTVVISPGENITFNVEARDENEIIQWQGSTTLDIVDDFSVNIELNPILPEASSLQATETGNRVNLSWTQSSDIDFERYELYRSRTGDDPWENIHTTADISQIDYIDETARAGNIYYYKVVVFDTEGFSAESNVVQIEVPGTPPTPVFLRGVAEGGYAYLYWEEYTDNDFERYDLYRSQSKNLWGQRVYRSNYFTDTYYLDEEVKEGIYYYRVVVYNTENLFSESNVVEVIIVN